MKIFERALEFLPENALVGLGSGHAASTFVQLLGEQVQTGKKTIRGSVPTSEKTADLAHQFNLPLISANEVAFLDITVDGADEVDPYLNLIKGYGRALVREKIVATLSRQLLILVGQEKLVSQLGERGFLPVEVVPFGLNLCLRELLKFGFEGIPLEHEGSLFVTDNGNHIINCRIPPLPNPHTLEQELLRIPGVVDTGLFLGMADVVLVGEGKDFELQEEKRRES